MHGLSLCKPCEGGKHIIAKAYVGAFELLDVKTKQGVSFFAKSEEVAIDELGNAVGKSIAFFKFINGLRTPNCKHQSGHRRDAFHQECSDYHGESP